MNQSPVFNPRFSVKSSFGGNEVDVSDGRYATKAGKAKLSEPKSMTCYDGVSKPKVNQPAINVQAARPMGARGPRLAAAELRDATRMDPTPQDRTYWKGKTVVQKTRLQVDPSTRRYVKPVRPQVTPAPQDRNYWKGKTVVQGTTQPNNPATLLKQAERAVHIQKINRQHLRNEAFTINVPASALEQDEFTLEVPEGVDIKNVEIKIEGQDAELKVEEAVPKDVEEPKAVVAKGGRYRRIADGVDDTARDYRQRKVVVDDRAKEEREYYKGKNIVASANRLKVSKFAPKND